MSTRAVATARLVWESISRAPYPTLRELRAELGLREAEVKQAADRLLGIGWIERCRWSGRAGRADYTRSLRAVVPLLRLA